MNGKSVIYSKDFLRSDPLINSLKAELPLQSLSELSQFEVGSVVVIRGEDLEQELKQFFFNNFNRFTIQEETFFEARVEQIESDYITLTSLLNGVKASIPFIKKSISFYSLGVTFTPPKIGDWLQLGTESMKMGVYREYPIVSSKNPEYMEGINYKVGRHHGFKTPGSFFDFPFPVKFKGIFDKSSSIVEVEVSGRPIQFVVPNYDLFSARVGSFERLKKMLDPIYEVPMSFHDGEHVNYRAWDGRVVQGKVISINGDVAQVRVNRPHFSDEGFSSLSYLISAFRWLVPLKIHIRRLYKTLGTSNPLSTQQSLLNSMSGESPIKSPEFRYFLDSILHFASTDEFRNLDLQTQLQLISELIHKHLPWQEMAGNIDSYVNWGQLLCFGAGVCRHHNPILGMALRELGFPVRLPQYRSDIFQDGHVWTEILVGREIWVIDLASRSQEQVFVHKRSDLIKRDKRYQNNIEYIYLQPASADHWD